MPYLKIIGTMLFSALLIACNDNDASKAALEVIEREILDETICAADQGPFSSDIDNPYFPLPIGRIMILEGDDEGTIVRVEIEVLDETELVDGVLTRVVEVAEFEDDEVIEITRDFYAQAPDGTVCYYGEDVDIYVDDVIVGHDGTWRVGEGDNEAGIIMPGDPMVNTEFAQESAPGIAEDRSAIVEVGVPVSIDYDDFADTVHAVDWNPLEEETFDDAEDKFYARDVGLVIDNVVELIELSDPVL